MHLPALLLTLMLSAAFADTGDPTSSWEDPAVDPAASGDTGGAYPPSSSYCGDGSCDEDEDPNSCPEDCGSCGNGTCDILTETPDSCPEDCDAVCGDGHCEVFQETHASCPEDCPELGPIDFRIRPSSGIIGARG